MKDDQIMQYLGIKNKFNLVPKKASLSFDLIGRNQSDASERQESFSEVEL